MNKRLKKRPFWLLLLSLLVLAACRQTSEAVPTPVMPTALSSSPEQAPTAVPTLAPAPTTTALPTLTPIPEEPVTAVPQPTLSASATTPPDAGAALPAQTYRVAFVTADDTLNVRSGPGVANAIVGTLSPNTANITITGGGQIVAGSTWVPIQAGDVSGWVNGRFLTTQLPNFCTDAPVQTLLEQLQSAILTRDGDALAQLVHPERGLRVRVDWWNPEILFRGDEVANLFRSTTGYNWGVQDGSGFDINGTFSEIVLPVLDADLLAPVTEVGCNQILAGPTAGLVVLPDGYEALNFVAIKRAPPLDGIEFDWGTWVVGIEFWQGRAYISYLVHYNYEI